MASERDRALAQAEAIETAQHAAARRATVPQWYWAGIGAGIGFVAFAIATKSVLWCVVAVLVVALGSRLMTALLARARGIRVTRLVAGPATWLIWPYVVVIGGVFLLVFYVAKASGELWAAALSALLAIVVTMFFGVGVDRVRRHPEDVSG